MVGSVEQEQPVVYQAVARRGWGRTARHIGVTGISALDQVVVLVASCVPHCTSLLVVALLGMSRSADFGGNSLHMLEQVVLVLSAFGFHGTLVAADEARCGHAVLGNDKAHPGG